MDIANKTILISGGGSGIGLEMARAMLAKEAKVIICGRTEAKLEAAKAAHPALDTFVCDITDAAQVAGLKEHCDNAFGGIDVLVNNAGIYHEYKVTDDGVSLEKQLAEIEIGMAGPVRMLHAFLPGLLTRPEAAVVNVSSGLAFVPLVRGPMFSAMKAAMHSWTRSIRKQLEPTKVKVFELIPPVTDTELVKDFDLKKLSPKALIKTFMKGLAKDQYEITAGQSGQLRFMSRVAPGFIFKAINQ